MSDPEININLALAIGYRPQDVRRAPDASNVIEVNRPNVYGDSWWRLDFASPTVIWPIAERYDAFPITNSVNWWVPGCHRLDRSVGPQTDTVAKAVALAVILQAQKARVK